MRKIVIETLVFVFSLVLFAGISSACKVPAETVLPSPAVGINESSRPISQVSYEQDVQPFFIENCILCHGSEKQAKGLRLDSYKGVMVGADSGAVIIPGEPENSSLIHTINPKRAEKILAWIQSGAPNN